MPSLASTYLIPALFLNPAFILHLINTFVSHMVPPPSTVSHSPIPVFEKLGPVPGATLYMDMHADDQLCWKYTALMVVVQLVAFGKVSGNRGQRKAKKAARLEKERFKKEKSEKLENERLQIVSKTEGHATGLDGAYDFREDGALKMANGNGHGNGKHPNGGKKIETETEESMTEMSEEEMNLV
jgi:hypothetical protein